MTNDRRAGRLVQEAIDQLALSMNGLVVLTEAATGPYAVTAAIAAAAGAEAILAVARDSLWGTAADAVSATRAMVRSCARHDDLTIVNEMSADVLRAADVVTNLGFVRPLDEVRVGHLKATSVVSLMCEPWEVRPEDVDVRACVRRGIVVIGTNESSPGWPVFAYSGPLAMYMLFEAGIEIFRSRIAVLGRDRFAPEIAKALRRAGASVRVDRRFTRASSRAAVRGADAIVVADYASDEVLVGREGLLKTNDLLEVAPDASIIQFAGGLDEQELRKNGFNVWPTPAVPPRRMSRTFAALGLKPVIELHAAGLRVGEAAARLRLQGVPAADAIDAVCRDLPIALPATNDASMVVGS
jgi:hypothetical protein